MDNQKKTIEPTLKIEAAHVDKLAEWLRRSGRPQSIKALTKRYVEILKEAAGAK